MSQAEGGVLRPRILVVDDNVAFRESTAEILALAGYEVAEAVDRAHALVELQGGRIDLMLLDLGIDHSGLRLLDESEQLPVVIGTSGADELPSDPRITALLRKPFLPDQLLVEVARCLDR